MLSPLFIDVEASGITAGCYPIEIGWTRAEAKDGVVQLNARSILVRPTDVWRSESWRWDPASVSAHGLTESALLRDGMDIDAACAILDSEFSGIILATDTGPGDWDDGWLHMLYEAAGRNRSWEISETKSGGHVAAHLRSKSLDPKVIRPALRHWAPPHSHAAAEDAMVFAWEWGMSELIGDSGVGDLGTEVLSAVLADLPSLIPKERWPRLTAESEARMRRRTLD